MSEATKEQMEALLLELIEAADDSTDDTLTRLAEHARILLRRHRRDTPDH